MFFTEKAKFLQAGFGQDSVFRGLSASKECDVAQEGHAHAIVFSDIQINLRLVVGFFDAVRTTKPGFKILHRDEVVTCPMSLSASIVSKNAGF